MTFEVPVRPVDSARRASWAAPVIAVSCAIAALIALALARPAGPVGDTLAAPDARGSAPASGEPSRALPPAAAAVAPLHPRRLPPTLGCEDLELDACVRI